MILKGYNRILFIFFQLKLFWTLGFKNKTKLKVERREELYGRLLMQEFKFRGPGRPFISGICFKLIQTALFVKKEESFPPENMKVPK